ncbi:DUF4352 domain-containing protein [Paenibacillus larvae]
MDGSSRAIKESDYIVQNGPHSRVYKKGESIKLNGKYGITAHSAKKVKSDVYYPETNEKIEVGKDKKIIEVKITLKNFSNKDFNLTTPVHFELLGVSSVMSYSGELGRDKVKPNETLNGSLFFVVPKDVSVYTLIYQPDLPFMSDVVKFKL